MATQFYLGSRPIVGLTDIRHHFIMIKHENEYCAQLFVRFSEGVMNNCSVTKLAYMPVVVDEQETWFVTVMGAGVDSTMNIYTSDRDDLSELNAGVEIAEVGKSPSRQHCVIVKFGESTEDTPVCATAAQMVTCFAQYDANVHAKDGGMRMPYRTCGPNCITFAMSLAQACGFDYQTLKHCDGLAGALNAGADFVIDRSFFYPLENYGPAVSHGQTYPPISPANQGVVCKDAWFDCWDGSTVMIARLFCEGTLAFRVHDRSSLMMETVAAESVNAEVRVASTIMLKELQTPRLNVHVETASTLHIANTANVGVITGEVLDCSTLMTSSSPAGSSVRVEGWSSWLK